MTSYQQLLQSIDDIKASGKKVTVTVLPSQVQRKRKALIWVTLTFFTLINNNMQETKFNIYGEMFHSNGYSRFDVLSYIAATREEALVTCKRLNPKFHIMSIWQDESKPEVVRMQPLI